MEKFHEQILRQNVAGKNLSSKEQTLHFHINFGTSSTASTFFRIYSAYSHDVQVELGRNGVSAIT